MRALKADQGDQFLDRAGAGIVTLWGACCLRNEGHPQLTSRTTVAEQELVAAGEGTAVGPPQQREPQLPRALLQGTRMSLCTV